MYEVYLAHHGILGQKWGIRRYQNADGSLTAAGRKRYAIDEDGKIRKLSGSERRAAAKTAKQRAEALEKARKTRAEKAEYNKEKAEAIKSGDASKINKYFDNLTPAEMKEAVDRINTKQNFQRMLNQEAQLVANGKTAVDKAMDTVSKVSDYAEKGVRMYNIIAKINNAFNDDAYMPSIGGEWAGDRKKKLEAERKADAKREKEEREAKKKEKEREEVEKLIRTADEYTLLQNRDKLNEKDWSKVAVRFNTEDKLLARMADKKLGEIKLQQKQHEWEAEDLSRLASEIPTAYKIRGEARSMYATHLIESIDRNKDLASNYRAQSVNIWKNGKASKGSFDKVAHQYTKEEQEEIRRARGW